MNPQSNQGRGKYERYGGPGLAKVAALLDRHALAPTRELTRLVQAVAFTVIIGNADAHAKNLSLLHAEPGVVELAPLYDTVPTALWPQLVDRAAMSVNGVGVLGNVTLDDVIAEAKRWAFDPSAAGDAATDVASRALGALEGIPEKLASLIADRATRFLQG